MWNEVIVITSNFNATTFVLGGKKRRKKSMPCRTIAQEELICACKYI